MTMNEGATRPMSTTTSVALPGFAAPAASFEQPFEMLGACHERVRRSLALLSRLIEHIEQHGHSQQTRDAASSVLRYFDQAGPHHHADEERHIFPVLHQHPDARVRQAAATLHADHIAMHEMWQRLRAVLLGWRDAPAPAPVSDGQRQLALDFITAYERHILLEDEVAYPAARALLDTAHRAAAGQERAARRQQS